MLARRPLADLRRRCPRAANFRFIDGEPSADNAVRRGRAARAADSARSVSVHQDHAGSNRVGPARPQSCLTTRNWHRLEKPLVVSKSL